MNLPTNLLPFLRSIIFGAEGDPTLPWTWTFRSTILGDNPKTLKLIHASHGKLLSELDPAEEYFHVEFFQDEPLYAELWLSQTWKQSNARRERIKLIAAKDRELYNEQKAIEKQRQALHDEIFEELNTGELPMITIAQLTKNLINNYDKYNLQALARDLDVYEIIERHRNQQ